MPSLALLDYLMVATILVLLVALLRVQERVQEPRLRLYVLSELVATMAIEAAALTWPDWNSRGYTVSFCLARSVDLSCAIWLSRPRAGTVISAFLLTAIAVIGLHGHVDLNSGIALAEGLGFVLAGMSMFCQPFSISNSVLVVLWLVLGGYNYTFAMGWKLPEVWKLADYWNTVLCIAAFTTLAVVGAKDGSAKSELRA